MNFTAMRSCVKVAGRQLLRPKPHLPSRSIRVRAACIHTSIRIRSLSSTSSSSSETSFDRSTIEGPHGKYEEEYKLSIDNPEAFWAKAADAIDWHTKPKTILQRPQPGDDPHQYRWFADGEMNTCYNCLDVHVQNGRGNQPALIYDSPVTGVKESFSYADLLDKVATFAGGLRDLGVAPGDRVVIYMPMIPEAVIAMLACARIGAVHSVVFGGFAAKELATRITDCQPKVIVSASAGVEPNRIVHYKPLLDNALELAEHNVLSTVLVQRRNVQECVLGPLDQDYEEFMASVSQPAAAVPLSTNHPHYV